MQYDLLWSEARGLGAVGIWLKLILGLLEGRPITSAFTRSWE